MAELLKSHLKLLLCTRAVDQLSRMLLVHGILTLTAAISMLKYTENENILMYMQHDCTAVIYSIAVMYRKTSIGF